MKTILLAFILLTNLNCFSQEQQEISTQLINVSFNSNWVLYASNEDFIVEYRYVNCDPSSGFDFESVQFKFTNLTPDKLSFSWDKILYYAGTCRTCDYLDEYHYDLSVEANSNVEADCSNESGYLLKIFSKFIDENYSKGDKLTSFQLDNLTVTRY